MHSEELMHGLDALRHANKLLDVSLIVEDRIFKVHRVVLAACSDYFKAMFTDAMKEANQSEIILSGLNVHGIEMIIEYIYTSKLELNLNNVQEVLSASTHIQMETVIEACSNYLESLIDLDNCVTIATLAEYYSLETLKTKAYSFLCSQLNEFSQTVDLFTLKWDQMEHMLVHNYPVDCSEERVLLIVLQYCYGTQVKTELAARLFAAINYEEISECSLNAIFSKLPNSEELCNKTNKEYIDLIRLAYLKKSKKSNGVVVELDNTLSNGVLINSRGMEKALVKIGGFETDGLTNEISCYLPTKKRWEMLTVIPHIEQCNYGTATLNNLLYVVGGSYDVCLKEYTHPFGFCYSPTKNKWKTIAPIQADRCRFSLNAMGTKYLYAVGGVCELTENDGGDEQWRYDMTISNCERYDITTDRWEYLPSLEENRSQHAGIVLGDSLYISGGIDRHLVLASMWCFNSKSNDWKKLCCMPIPRADHVLVAFEEFIYACGGWYEDPVSETRTLVETIDVYNITNNSWTTETHIPVPMFYSGVAAIKRKIYFVGGLLSTEKLDRASSTVQSYDLDTKEWNIEDEWEYPKEVWECTCVSLYVPQKQRKYNCTNSYLV